MHKMTTYSIYSKYPKPIRAALWPCVFLMGLCFCRTISAAVTFSVAPASVSNTYNGTITLQVGGLVGGDTVVVQKFLDANTNGVVDTGDMMVQQFRLTDGQAPVIGGVTNINVPGDSNPASGAITAQWNFQNGLLSQILVAQYLFVLSSPTGAFAPITNHFTVTNTPSVQSISGTVTSGTNIIPNAVILLFEPLANGDQNPQAGAVANNLGAYTVQAPPGYYVVGAFRSNYVANLGAGPFVSLGAGARLTNITINMVPPTQSISGQFVDANNTNHGLPGTLVPMQTTNGLLAIGFTDTNGNFNVPTVANGKWKVENGSSDMPFQGYLGLQNSQKVDTTGGSQGNVVVALPKATALFYGSVKDNYGTPLAGVSLSFSDGNQQYDSEALSGQNGYYVAGVVAQTWYGNISSATSLNFSNYVFSQPLGVTNSIQDGQALEADFVAILATNHISGYITNTSGVPVTNVAVYANATIPDNSGTNFQSFNGYTDASGHYVLNVANGNWTVSPDCNSGDNNGLGSLGYSCPDYQNVTISNNNAVVNFAVEPCGFLQIITNDLPIGYVNQFYDNFLGANGCNQPFNWMQTGGSLPPGLNLYQNGEIVGNPSSAGTLCFAVQVTDNNNNTTNGTLCIIIDEGLQITTTNLPDATQGQFYSASLTVSGGVAPYIWNVAPSNNLPTGLSLSTNGILSGTPSFSGFSTFAVQVTDSNQTTAVQTLGLNVSPALSPLQITTFSLPNGMQGQFYSANLNASGGNPPYTWMLSPSNNLPAGLNLSTNGLISGTPSQAGTNCFSVQVTDASSNTTNGTICLIINFSFLQVTTTTLPNGSEGVFYSFPLGASGGQPPYT